MEILLVIASALDVVLVLVTMLAILKLPGLLERQASLLSQAQQSQRETLAAVREVLAEIRSVTRQQ